MDEQKAGNLAVAESGELSKAPHTTEYEQEYMMKVAHLIGLYELDDYMTRACRYYMDRGIPAGLAARQLREALRARTQHDVSVRSQENASLK